jgi:hypothetical protein
MYERSKWRCEVIADRCSQIRSIKRRHFSIFSAEHTEIDAHISKEAMIAHKMIPLECVRSLAMQRDRSFEMVNKCCLAAIAAQIEQHFTLRMKAAI